MIENILKQMCYHLNRDLKRRPVLRKKIGNWNKVISIHFTDTKKDYWFEMTKGNVNPLKKGKRDGDISFETTEDIFLNVISGKMNPMIAVTTKRIKVKGTLAEVATVLQIIQTQEGRIKEILKNINQD